MNHRHALKVATDAALALFLLMTVGVVLWTTDEMLDWNILPDWVDAYAQLIVILMSVLAGFAVIISLMCSVAVIAASAAERAGIPGPTPSRRARVVVTLGVLLALTIMVALQRVDEHREAKRIAARREEHRQRYYKDQGTLRSRIPGILERFTPDMRSYLASPPSEHGDAELARLLKAIHLSTPLGPGVTVMIPAPHPYTYQVISARSQPERVEDGKLSLLAREHLIDLPSIWERDSVAALFTGQELTIPHGRSGAFIDTREPCAWGLVRTNDTVTAILMLRAR